MRNERTSVLDLSIGVVFLLLVICFMVIGFRWYERYSAKVQQNQFRKQVESNRLEKLREIEFQKMIEYNKLQKIAREVHEAAEENRKQDLRYMLRHLDNAIDQANRK